DYISNFFDENASIEELENIYHEEMGHLNFEEGFQVAYSSYSLFSLLYIHEPTREIMITNQFLQIGLGYVCKKWKYTKPIFSNLSIQPKIRQLLYSATLLGYISYVIFLKSNNIETIKHNGIIYPKWKFYPHKSRVIRWTGEKEEKQVSESLEKLIGFSLWNFSSFIRKYQLFLEIKLKKSGIEYKKIFFGINREIWTELNEEFQRIFPKIT
ncbi:hypothetical protein, partial [Mycoplasma marinum]